MIYSASIASKTNLPIPLFADGTAMHSKYDPEREAASFGDSIADDCGFVLVAGIGAGYHIQSLISKKPALVILAVEADEQSLEFCRSFPIVQTLSALHTVTLCTVHDAPLILLRKYLPSLHGSFAFLPQRAWGDKNNILLGQLKLLIEHSLSSLRADYSVQTHFGRLWQRNILLNAKQLETVQIDTPDVKKIAAVIAAGPSLDKNIHRLTDDRSSYYIISTDTAYGPLLLRGISPDAVVSVDGQSISKTHFYICPQASKDKNTLFIFDLCASPDAVRLVKTRGYRTLFIQSGHPLSQFISSFTSIPSLKTGAGTVTIAACDWARVCGFKTIELFGADFSYSSGKPYAKGTYLDKKYYYEDFRLGTAENYFDTLLYRTPILPAASPSEFSGILDRPFTTEVLDSYRQTLLSWAEENGFYKTECSALITTSPSSSSAIGQSPVDMAAFHRQWSSCLHSEIERLKHTDGVPLYNDGETLSLYTVLPYIAWLKNSNQTECAKLPLFELIKLAYSDAVRYT